MASLVTKTHTSETVGSKLILVKSRYKPAILKKISMRKIEKNIEKKNNIKFFFIIIKSEQEL